MSVIIHGLTIVCDGCRAEFTENGHADFVSACADRGWEYYRHGSRCYCQECQDALTDLERDTGIHPGRPVRDYRVTILKG